MRALVLDRPVMPSELCEALRITDLPDPVPGPGEIRVQVEAGALNPTDYQRAQYGVPEWEWPAVLGLDVVGRVDLLGPGVDNVDVGDRVAYVGDIRARGGFADYTIANAMAVAKVPASVSAVAAAALPSAGLTAYQAVVRRLDVAQGDCVLITGGAGGVGGFAVQLAALRGARVVVTEHPDNTDAVLALGAERVIDFRSDGLADAVAEFTGGRGLDGVVDTIGTESATTNLTLLAHGGGLASIAGRPNLDAVPPFRMAPSVHEIALGAAYMVDDTKAVTNLAEMMGDLLRLLSQGELDPMIGRTVDLSEVPAALTQLASRTVRGKIVHQFT